MTAFSDADLDRLADFVGGALDGTPEAERVRRLVSTDATWAEAYAALVTAEATVRDELLALGTEPVTVPPDVAQRLDAALAGAVSAPPADAPVVDLARAREARRHRRQRWVAGLAAAAAVLVCGGLGIRVMTTGGADEKTQSSAGDYAPAQPQQAAPSGATGTGGTRTSRGATAIAVTGRDYGPDTVGQVLQASPVPQAALGAEGTTKGADTSKQDTADVSGPLRRLADPAARGACLTAIVGEYGGQVALVDYARFQGEPALIVLLDGTRLGAGKRLVVVVGPDCGLGGAIADERYRSVV